jgi:hypothetical protein
LADSSVHANSNRVVNRILLRPGRALSDSEMPE